MISLLKLTFYITYVFLITTGSVTFIEALATKDPHIRHILNIETVISIVAGFFYSQFVTLIKDTPNYTQLIQTRYLDWSITTPFMLLSLCLALGYKNHKKTNLWVFLSIVFFNYGMLVLGYLGERKLLQKDIAMITSFISFIIMFSIIYWVFIKGYSNTVNLVIFFSYVILWSIYGFVYKTDEETKNTVYNVLDLCSKCFTGLFFWMYFAKIITL
jgi:bacteriorhodopsin